MAKVKRRIMRNFRLDEISAVDTPAQTGAVMTLMKKQVRKAIGDQKFLAKDFAYVGDPRDTNTWKYRLTDKPGAKPSKKRLDQVIKAVAGMMNGQMPGQMPMAAQRYHIPEDAIESVLDKLREAWTMAYGGGAGAQPMPDELDPAAAEEETDDAAAIDTGVDNGEEAPIDEEAVDEEAAAEDEEAGGEEDAAATAAAAAAAATEAAGAAKPKPKKKPPPAKKQSLAERIGKRYIDPMDGAKTFAEVLDCYEQDRKYSEVMEVAWPLVSALDTSLRSVVASRDLDTAAKHAALRSSVEGFLALMREEMPEVEEVLEKALSAAEKEEYDMTTAKGTAGGSSSPKTDDKAQVEALTKAAADEKARAEKAEAELATLKAVAALNGDEKEHYDRLKDDVAKAAFLGMDKSARFTEIKKALAGDETIVVAGQSIAKSAVGDTMFAVLKAQAAQTATLEKQLADERVARQDAEISKRADVELAGMPGTSEEKRDLLKALDAMPEAQRDYAKKLFAAASKTAGMAFERIGSGAPMHTIKKSDGTGFEKRVQEVLKRDGSTRQDAIRKARAEFPEEFSQWQAGN